MLDVDPVLKIEHDHHHLTRMVESVREAIQATLRGEQDQESLREYFDELFGLFSDELYEHFDREEQGLFPYILEQFPDQADTIQALERAHDRMCGIASRMEYQFRNDAECFGANFDTFIALFARFDANYVQHARDEARLLRELRGRLDDTQRRCMNALLREL